MSKPSFSSANSRLRSRKASSAARRRPTPKRSSNSTPSTEDCQSPKGSGIPTEVPEVSMFGEVLMRSQDLGITTILELLRALDPRGSEAHPERKLVLDALKHQVIRIMARAMAEHLEQQG